MGDEKMTDAAYAGDDHMTAAIPRIDLRRLTSLLVAGAFATIAFDLFGETISPLLGGIVPGMGSKLAPTPLATQALSVIFDTPGQTISAFGLGFAVHWMTGLLAYPVGWAYVAQPLARRVAPGLPWWAAAALYGVALWVFALYVMAHLVAGNPAFLGFTGITWTALWGHVLFALVAAAIWRRREG
jgi:hypothetical protein